MSGGEQQMLAIGRALMAKPKLLLLDEPSMGIAPILVERIYETIAEINRQGTTILLVEQNANYALSVSQRGYVLETGAVALADDVRQAAHEPRRPEGLPRRMTVARRHRRQGAVAALRLAGLGDRRVVAVGRKGYGEKAGPGDRPAAVARSRVVDLAADARPSRRRTGGAARPAAASGPAARDGRRGADARAAAQSSVSRSASSSSGCANS